MKSKNIIVPLVVYPFDVMVSVNQTPSQFKKSLDKYEVRYDEREIDDGVPRVGRCIQFENNSIAIILYDFDLTPRHYGYLQHEIFHAVHFVMDTIGTPLTMDTAESFTYLIAYLTQEIYRQL